MSFKKLIKKVICGAVALNYLTLLAIADEIKIDESKRMSKEEIEHKREGSFVTGLPTFGSDPVNGQGVGADLFLYNNGKKTDPLFEYTPYRSKTEIHAYLTNKDQKEATVAMDIPYIFNSTWRIRFEGGYEDNPNLLYFGKNSSTLNKLNFQGNTYNRYSDYTDALDQSSGGISNQMYNTYRKQESIVNISAENSYLDGKLRLLVGVEAAQVKISTFDGKNTTGSTTQGTSLLQEEDNAGNILGLGNNLVSIMQFGAIYDTRDFEPDPTKGWFIELTDEYSSKAFGSAFDFNKVFFHSNYYQKILSNTFDHLVFAGRYALSLTDGDAPFYEFQDSWSSEGSIEGLGGGGTLRGYKQSRFLGRAVSWINLETRWRFADTDLWGQHLSFTLVPFIDLGRVWDKLADYSFDNYKTTQGLGLRVPWNQSTILSFDYATSSEDEQFFFTYGHIF